MNIAPKRMSVIAAIFGLAGLAGLMRAHAQETTASGTTSSSDSIVAIAADSRSLPQVAPAQVPVRGGTFWWVYPGGEAIPTPCLPMDANPQIYRVTTDEFLVDLTAGQVMVTPYQLEQEAQTTNAYAAAVAAQLQGLMNLITMVQTPTSTTTTATTMTLSAKPMDGGFSPMYQTSNGVPYLTIAPTGTNQFLVTVYNNTSPEIYEIWWTAALANPDYPWQQLAIGASGQTNFTVGTVSPNGFFRAIWDTNGVPTSGLTITIQSPLNGSVLY